MELLRGLWVGSLSALITLKFYPSAGFLYGQSGLPVSVDA